MHSVLGQSFIIRLWFFHGIECFLQSVEAVKPEEPVLLPGDAELNILTLQSISKLCIVQVIQHLQALWKPAAVAFSACFCTRDLVTFVQTKLGACGISYIMKELYSGLCQYLRYLR